MTPQEIEEHNYNPQSDHQNAYAVSQMRHQDDPRIQQAINDGKYVVTAYFDAHCPMTDALLPNPHKSLVSIHDTRELAQQELDLHREQFPEDDLGIEPRPPRIQYTREYDDDTPF